MRSALQTDRMYAHATNIKIYSIIKHLNTARKYLHMVSGGFSIVVERLGGFSVNLSNKTIDDVIPVLEEVGAKYPDELYQWRGGHFTEESAGSDNSLVQRHWIDLYGVWGMNLILKKKILTPEMRQTLPHVCVYYDTSKPQQSHDLVSTPPPLNACPLV